MRQKLYHTILWCLSTILCFHLYAQDSWVAKNPIPISSRSNPVCYSIGNKGYLATGWAAVTTTQLLEYNPSTDTWTALPDLPGTPRKGASGFAIGDKIYIGTGWYDNTYAGTFLNDFWEYNTTTSVWTQKANFPGGARAHAVGFSIGSKGYIGSGNNASTPFNTFYEYDPSTDTWTQIANLATYTRSYAAAFTIGNKGYVGLGITGSFQPLGDLWEYNPSTGVWTQKAMFPHVPRTGASGFSIGDRGYMGFGYDGYYLLHDLWEYNPACDKWYNRLGVGYGNRRSAAGAFSLGNKGYIATGAGPSPGTNTLFEYTPYKLFTDCVTFGSYCSGTSISVPYNSSNITFNSGNIFTAQLSDANGSFASPTNIGTLTSTATSGNISATLPSSNIPTGNNYRVRVVSSSTATIGADNGTGFTIIGDTGFPWYGDAYTSADQSVVLEEGIYGHNYICAGTYVYFHIDGANSASQYTYHPSPLYNTPSFDGWYMSFYMDPGAWATFSVDITVNGCPKTVWFTFYAMNCGYGYYSLAPNPVSSDLTIYVDDEKLKNQKIAKSPDQVIQQVIIMDKLGTVVAQQKYPSDTKKISLNVSGLSPDMYIARIFNGKTWTSIKFIKK